MSVSTDFSVSDLNFQQFSEEVTPGSFKISRKELASKKNEIKLEWAKSSKDVNLLILMIYFHFCFTWVLIGIKTYQVQFAVPEILCSIENFNTTFLWDSYEKGNISSPSHYIPGCYYYDYNYSLFQDLQYNDAISVVSRLPKPRILKCQQYKIMKDVPKGTSLIREFNAFCIKKEFQKSKLYFHFGTMLFIFPIGIVADIYGRRPVLRILTMFMVVSAWITPFCTTFAAFSVVKVVEGGALSGSNLLLAVIFSESYQHKYRESMLIVSIVWYTLLVHSMKISDYVIEQWRLSEMAYATSIFICLFGAFVVIPESMRFLMIKKQIKEAWFCLQTFGSNQFKESAINYKFPSTSIRKQLSIAKKSYIRHRIYLILLLVGITIYFLYIFQSMKKTLILETDTVNMQLMLVEVFLQIFMAAVSLVFTKKIMIFVNYILLSACMVIKPLTEGAAVSDVSALAGKIFAIALYILIFAYKIEIFPTSHRTTCCGFIQMIRATIEALAEFFKEDLALTRNETLYLCLYAAMCITCALATIVGPESSSELPDTVQDLFENPHQEIFTTHSGTIRGLQSD